MRVGLLMIAFAALIVSLDAREDARPMRLAQSGPLPTAALNPRLGTAPPGGHLGETMRQPGAVAPDVGAVPVDPTRLGQPPVNAIPNPAGAAAGAVPPPGAVAPPAAGVVPPAVAPGAAPVTGGIAPPAAGAR